MKVRKLIPLVALVGVSTWAADTVTNGTPDEAFQAGKDFASSMQDNVTTDVLNEQSAQAHLDYTASPPQASSYQTLPPRSMGTDKQNYCASVDMSTLSSADRKECEAVNYLLGVQGRTNPYTLNESTDPLFARYKEGIELSEKINADTCSIEGSTIPSSSGRAETCTESYQRSDRTCNESLTVDVQRVGRSYTLEFAVTTLIAKWQSNGCEEDYSQGSFEFDLGKFTSFFNWNDYQSGKLWSTDRYVSWAQGVPQHYGSNYRVRLSMIGVPDVYLQDNGRKCHVTSNLLSGFYIRPIYSQDMIDFLFKESGLPKPNNTSSFKDVELFKVVSVTPPPGVSVNSTASPACGAGDVPKYQYTLNGASLDNPPKQCNTNPGREVEITDGTNGKFKLTVSKGSPPYSYHYAHNIHANYIGNAHPLRIKFLVEKYQTSITDNWDDGCSPLRQ